MPSSPSPTIENIFVTKFKSAAFSLACVADELNLSKDYTGV